MVSKAPGYTRDLKKKTAIIFDREITLIDSPGIREFGLTKVTRQEVVRGFPEIQSLATSCKFRDCSHSGEPSCAIRDGIRKGVISEERFDSYQNILGTLD